VNARELLIELRRKGFSLAVEGDGIRVRPASQLPAELRQAIVTCKGELLAILAVLGTQTSHTQEDRREAMASICRYPSHRRFWYSVHGPLVCFICHPPAHEGLIERWEIV
jgi:hypothetical protein